MNFIDKVMDKWNAFCEKTRPAKERFCSVMGRVSDALAKAWKFVFRMRKVIMAIPVAWGAVSLAIYNLANLPKVVGLGLENSGEFSILIVRELAVLGPLAVTALCLLLMFVSRRTLTPWMVSLFSLSLPLLILITNTFPA